MPSEAGILLVEVVYALPERAVRRVLRLQSPATVADALQAAAADSDLGAVVLQEMAVGVFGVLVRPEEPLHDGDRLEIYRALKVDPKAARRTRAKQQRRGR